MVYLEYPTKIVCREDDFKTEFQKAFASISQLCLTEFNGSCKEKRKPNQLAVLKQMFEQNSVQYSHFIQFIQTLLRAPPRTSPVERGYTYLQMVAAKRRNHLRSDNIETLFMLVSLKLPSRKLGEYKEEVILLQGDVKYLEFEAFILKLCFIYFSFVFS